MKTKDIIAGLQILLPYYDAQDLYNCGAEYDTLYAYPTEKPLSQEDIQNLISLGWTQQAVDTGDDDFSLKHYDPEEGWSAHV